MCDLWKPCHSVNNSSSLCRADFSDLISFLSVTDRRPSDRDPEEAPPRPVGGISDFRSCLCYTPAHLHPFHIPQLFTLSPIHPLTHPPYTAIQIFLRTKGSVFFYRIAWLSPGMPAVYYQNIFYRVFPVKNLFFEKQVPPHSRFSSEENLSLLRRCVNVAIKGDFLFSLSFFFKFIEFEVFYLQTYYQKQPHTISHTGEPHYLNYWNHFLRP